MLANLRAEVNKEIETDDHPAPGSGDRPAAHTALAHAVERLLVAGVGVTAIAISEAGIGADLTFVQWRALAIVASSGGMRVGQLAAHLDVAVPSASRLVRRIERRGLFVATRDEADRRATIVRPTVAGQRVHEAVISRRRALIVEALDGSTAHALTDPVAVIEAVARALSRT